MCSNDYEIGSQELVCASWSFREKEGAITALHPGIVIVFQEEDFGVIKETEKNKSNLRFYCEKSRS